MWILNKLFPDKLGDKRASHRQDTEKSTAGLAGSHSLRNILKPQYLVTVLLLATTAAAAHSIEFREKTPINRTLSEFPASLGKWQGGASAAIDGEILSQLDLSDYTIVNYRDGTGQQVNVYIAYYQTQRKGESIHSPKSCLPGSGWEFRQAGRVGIPLSSTDGFKSIPVNRAVMTKSGYKQLAYYWFPMRGRILTNIFEMKLYNFWDALTQQRTDGALVRLITPIRKNESIEDADARLQAFTREMVPVLNKFLPQ
jgi:EpsI family protein